MLEPEDAASLIEPLIEGIAEDPPWSSFLERLRRRADAHYASLVFRPLSPTVGRSGVVHLYAGQPSPPIISQLYRDSLYKSDPLPYRQLDEGRVYALGDLLLSGDPAHDAYRAQLLAPSGMNVLRIVRVAETSGVSAWLTVSRQAGDFEPNIESLLAGLVPFLRAALRSYVTLERERMAAQVANEAINRMSFGWLTLDADGRILDTDPGGENMLAAAVLLIRSRSGKLTARGKRTAQKISAAIQELAGDPHSRPRAIVLSREPWLDMLLVRATLETGPTRPAPALVCYVHADNWSSTDRCEQLCQLFDLVPSEARLALALSRGMSIAEAASDLGLTVESARTYSKKIYAKTGARGQSDLVRFIHRSVLALT